MKKHLIIAICLFIIVAGLGLATNFIDWDETPLEQTIYAAPLGLGLLLEIPFFFTSAIITSNGKTNYSINYTLLNIIIPFVAGLLYATIYYSIVLLLKRNKKDIVKISTV